VLLGWSRPLYLHLGRGWALLQVARGQVEVIRFAATLPLSRQLEKVGQALDCGKERKKVSGLYVTLSAAICPAVAVPVPRNVRAARQRLELARGVVSAAMGSAPEHWVCDVDPARAGIAAAVPRTVVSDILSWASQKKIGVRSIAPLWSLASECRSARARGTRGLSIHEPDAITVLAADDNNAPTGASWPVAVDDEAVRRRADDWLLQRGISAERQLHLAFGTEVAIGALNLPHRFANYWAVE
jgi:hypothetical protein